MSGFIRSSVLEVKVSPIFIKIMHAFSLLRKFFDNRRFIRTNHPLRNTNCNDLPLPLNILVSLGHTPSPKSNFFSYISEIDMRTELALWLFLSCSSSVENKLFSALADVLPSILILCVPSKAFFRPLLACIMDTGL
jgi:hypothetical protein